MPAVAIRVCARAPPRPENGNYVIGVYILTPVPVVPIVHLLFCAAPYAPRAGVGVLAMVPPARSTPFSARTLPAIGGEPAAGLTGSTIVGASASWVCGVNAIGGAGEGCDEKDGDY